MALEGSVGCSRGLTLRWRAFSPEDYELTQYGTYGEVAVLPAYSLAKYPSGLNSVEATAIWMQIPPSNRYGWHLQWISSKDGSCHNETCDLTPFLNNWAPLISALG